MDGFIYIMSNVALGNRIKIGKSSRDPKSFREKELNDTAIPESFKVEFSAFVENFDEIEKQVHQVLDQHRPNKNREFFTCSIPEAISVIETLAKIKFKEVFYESPELILIEKVKQNIKKKSQIQNEILAKAFSKVFEDFNNWALNQRKNEVKVHKSYPNNTNNLHFYVNLFFSCFVSIVVIGLLYSFFISDGPDGVIFCVIAGMITGYVITNNFRNKDIDEIVKKSEEEYPLIYERKDVSKLSNFNYKIYSNMCSKYDCIQPKTKIICVINEVKKECVYFKETNTKYADLDYYLNMRHLEIEDTSWIYVNSEEEALEMGFKKASANYDFSNLGLPIDTFDR